MFLQLFLFLCFAALLHHSKLCLLVFSLNQQVVLLLFLRLGIICPHFCLLPVVATQRLLLLQHLFSLCKIDWHVRDRLRFRGRDAAMFTFGLD